MRRSEDIKGRARLIGWLALLLIAAAVCLSDSLRAAFLGQVMLFTQKSPQTLAGALRSGGIWTAFWLALFRTAVLPWLPPLVTIADTMVYGKAVGILLSWTSHLLAAACCFALSRWLIAPLVKSWLSLSVQRRIERWGGVLCIVLVLWLPGMGGVAGYLLGGSGLSLRRWLAATAAAELADALSFGLFCSPYQTALPAKVQLVLRLTAILVVLTAVVFSRRRTDKR